jgi:uncharacterized integral membrane protein
MNWKLVAFIVIMALVLVFIGFNLDNRCDISIVFMTFQQVPVVITILGTYLLGLVSALVLSIGRHRRITGVAGAKSSKSGSQARSKNAGDSAPDQSSKAP